MTSSFLCTDLLCLVLWWYSYILSNYNVLHTLSCVTTSSKIRINFEISLILLQVQLPVNSVSARNGICQVYICGVWSYLAGYYAILKTTHLRRVKVWGLGICCNNFQMKTGRHVAHNKYKVPGRKRIVDKYIYIYTWVWKFQGQRTNK